MDQKTWNQIKKASEDSLKNPGKNFDILPKEESLTDPEIYVFRHGETFDNVNRIFSGWRNSQLTNKGIYQAEVLSKKLKNKNIQLCIVSPLVRTQDTAEIALKYHMDMVYEIDERIIERNYGDLQGYSKEKLMKENEELAIKYRRSYDFPPPNGESMEMVEKRVFPFCEELIERVKRENINVAISCHGNSMRAIRRYFEGLSIVEELTIENPLGQDYAEYVVKVSKWREAEKHFTKADLKKLRLPNNQMG
jgi:2,3-bisphosphoglycerate-dependent phosphoglycerate mutase